MQVCEREYGLDHSLHIHVGREPRLDVMDWASAQSIEPSWCTLERDYSNVYGKRSQPSWSCCHVAQVCRRSGDTILSMGERRDGVEIWDLHPEIKNSESAYVWPKPLWSLQEFFGLREIVWVEAAKKHQIRTKPSWSIQTDLFMANNDIREQSFSPICMGRMFRMISVANFHLSGPHREQHMFVNFQQIYGKQMWNHKPKMEYYAFEQEKWRWSDVV